ncbi:MAG: SH3 domain-containing protein [Bacteroidia bacterium]
MKYTSILFVAAFAMLGASAFAQKPAGTYYVGANAGLNLRATTATTSEKLDLAMYGEEVKILEAAKDASMTVDGIKGGMAKVQSGGKTGYMFDGYLLPVPAPTKGEEVEKYAGRLWESGADVFHEEIRRDWGGYAQFQYNLYFKDLSWSEAFIIARNLYSLPPALQYPGDKGSGELTTKNPNASAEAWTDEMVSKYVGGQVASIIYSHRGEGGGSVISVVKSDEENYTIKISELDIAD